MKKIIILSIALILSFASYSQHISKALVPAPVLSQFAALYPSVDSASWYKVNGQFEADFTLSSVATTATFDAAGNLIVTVTGIALSDLPSQVSVYFSVNVPGGIIINPAKIKYTKGITNYQAESNGINYIFNQNGALITKVKAGKNSDMQ